VTGGGSGATRLIARAASTALALSVVVIPWYALDAYQPNGWDATWWARAALAAALVNAVALQLRRDRLALAAAAVALACVAVRVVSPPDFGFAFDGLTVPVERQAGCWVALAASLLALLASARLVWRPERPSSPETSTRPEPEPPPPPAPSSAASRP
jgi:hypothetical protein